MFVAAGPAVLEPLIKRGHSIFLDLKFHDIPNTVAGAVRSAASLGVRMMTVHASGGPAMLAAARAALDGIADPPELLAVTVLTSMDGSETAAVGLERSPAEQVELLARMGLAAGIRGFVCSPQEVRIAARPHRPGGGAGRSPAFAPRAQRQGIRSASPRRPTRCATGASYLVVGRPITQAADPAEAAEAILREMAEALEQINA